MLGDNSILLSADVRGGSVHDGKQAIDFHLNSIDFQRRWWTRRFLGEHPTKEDVGSCRGQDHHGEILLYCSQRERICAERMRKRDDAWTHEGGRVERGRRSTDKKRSELQQESAPINGLSY